MAVSLRYRQTINGRTTVHDAPTWLAALVWLLALVLTVGPWVLGVATLLGATR